MPSTEYGDLRLWVVAAFGALGFLLSVYNTWRGHRVAKESRSNRDELQKFEKEHKARVVRLEEFRSSVRDPIRNASADLAPISRRLDGLANTRKSIDDLTDELDELNAQTQEAIGRVIDALQDANASRFAGGEDWADDAYATEDRVAEALNVAGDKTQPQAKRLQAVATASVQLIALRNTVNIKVDDLLEHYADQNLST